MKYFYFDNEDSRYGYAPELSVSYLKENNTALFSCYDYEGNYAQVQLRKSDIELILDTIQKNEVTK